MSKHDPLHLTDCGDGRWCKRVRGVLHKFGRRGGTKDEAMRHWLKVKDDLIAGRRVRAVRPGRPRQLTVKLLIDSFLTAWMVKAKAGKIRAATYDDYYRALDDFGVMVGLGRDPADLTPDDFRHVRSEWDKRMGPWALDRNVQAVRTMFKWAIDPARLTDKGPWYGDQFHKSTEADKREAARERQRERGDRRFTIKELGAILSEAEAPLKAMVLLGLNGGMYATDIARLRRSDIKREGKLWVVDFDRTKTGGVWWKFPLWPETKEAIDDALGLNRVARDPADADLVFLTVRGNVWHKENVTEAEGAIETVSETHGIGQELDKVLDAERKGGKLRRAGVGFGSLRHTHVTAVGDHPDKYAARRVRGHKIVEIEKHYDAIPIERLKAVTDLARRRLLQPALAAARQGRKARPQASGRKTSRARGSTRSRGAGVVV
jgi:integrase